MNGEQIPVQVDIKTLEGAVTWLEGLRDHVSRHMIEEMPEIKRLLGSGGEVTSFGGQTVGTTLSTSADTAYTQARDGLETVRDNLDNAVAATREIIKRYRTVEERNRADVAVITKAFESDAADGSSDSSDGSNSGADSGSGEEYY